MLTPYISKTSTPIFLYFCMWPRHVPRKVYVKFQKIPFTNKTFLSIAKRKAAGGRFSMRVITISQTYFDMQVVSKTCLPLSSF